MKKEIEIQLSKSNLLLLAIGATGFVVMGILFAIKPSNFQPHQQTLITTLGIVSILFFGACLLFMVKKLFDNKAGLMIDENGITDNSSGTSVGLIEWEDITNIKTSQVGFAKFILIETTNPEKYISKAKNSISKKGMRANHKTYGTPLSISSNTLQIKFDELLKVILQAYKTKQSFN